MTGGTREAGSVAMCPYVCGSQSLHTLDNCCQALYK